MARSCNLGLCTNFAVCHPGERFGARCSGDGRGDDCPIDQGCSLDAIYFGSRKECVVALDPIEPYCRIGSSQNASGFEYVESSWAECGSGGDGDICGKVGEPTEFLLCEDGSACVQTGGSWQCQGSGKPCDNRCFYGTGIHEPCDLAPIANSREKRCGAGGPGLCADGTQCLFVACNDGTLCSQGQCGDLSKCDLAPSRCADGSQCGDKLARQCADGTPCFRAATDRTRWRYEADSDIVGTPRVASCTDDPGLYRDPNGRTIGIDPQPIDNHCVFIATNTSGKMYALDEEQLIVGPGHPTEQNTADGSCLWVKQAHGNIQSMAAADDVWSEQHLFVGTLTGRLHDFYRSPTLQAACPASSVPNPHNCNLLIEKEGSTLPLVNRGGTDVKGDSTMSKTVPHRLVVGAGKHLRLIDTSLLDPVVEIASLANVGNRKFRRGPVEADTTGIFYTANGSSTTDSGAMAFELSADGNSLETRGEVDRGDTAVNASAANCDGNQDGAPAVLDKIQWHRTYAVLNERETHFFVSTRATKGDTRKRLVAFEADADLTADDLIDCAPEPPGLDAAVVAPAAVLRLPCALARSTGCCGDGTTHLDRLLIGDKDSDFHAFDFCDGLDAAGTGASTMAAGFLPEDSSFSPQNLSGSSNKYRAMAGVALDLGTVYAVDETTDNQETVYAIDAYDFTKKWVYTLNGNHCANTGPSGEDCYPSPIPNVWDYGNGQFFPVDDNGCFDQASILLLIGAHTADPTNPTTRDFYSDTIDSWKPTVLPKWPLQSIEVVNLTTGTQQFFGCPYACGGVVGLALGWNEIVVKNYDKGGKPGGLRIRIERKTQCSA